jgi:hypothetical protein
LHLEGVNAKASKNNHVIGLLLSHPGSVGKGSQQLMLYPSAITEKAAYLRNN